MRRLVVAVVALVAVLAAAGGVYWFGAQGGWFGAEHDAGVIQGKAIPEAVIASRVAATAAAAPAGDEEQILFGDLHVHTTFSADAFQFSLPLLGGSGAHPLADACDYARYCSALDFWASTDHAESITPLRWTRVKESVRACQKIAGNDANPDLVSFIGFEWTQVGRTPDEHFGHKNVIFRDLDDDKVSARPIAATGNGGILRSSKGMSPLVPLKDFSNRQHYFDYNTFASLTREVKDCDANTPSDKLPTDCYEAAARPADLVRKMIDEQKLAPLIIPHGTSWGFYTPAGTNWVKALDPGERPEKFPVIEIYSGHGNSEEFRSWNEVVTAADGTQSCPQPTKDYLPSCWRAGEIILERCLKAKIEAGECEARAATARQSYVDMRVSGLLSVPGAKSEDWLDAGQCTDCFLPAFNFRPGTSVQAGLATTHFSDDGAQATRFNWGFIGSSDTHRARPGTGYKQVDRHENTDAAGPPNSDLRNLLFPQGADNDENPNSRSLTREEIAKFPPLQTIEAERQATFLTTGGLAAVHAANRSRAAIWEALQRREIYATSGQKILLWFNAVDKSGAKTSMGGRVSAREAPVFEVRAAGAFKQKPGCPDFATAGLDEGRIKKICSGECDNPSDVRSRIVRIEVVKIRPQAAKGEALASLIQDRFIVHECKDEGNGCTFTFSDPEFAAGQRDALYYVKAIQEAEPMINAERLHCERDANGKCVKVQLCFGDYRSGASDCTAPAEPRAWSSPIYVDYAKGG
ncbi:MAG: DUF3604 domain-containing protein [Alphaproteobacteria bacterium]|nr:DUF3604 domain-containing protein [Alphaproteobacteria bacterium]